MSIRVCSHCEQFVSLLFVASSVCPWVRLSVLVWVCLTRVFVFRLSGTSPVRPFQSSDKPTFKAGCWSKNDFFQSPMGMPTNPVRIPSSSFRNFVGSTSSRKFKALLVLFPSAFTTLQCAGTVISFRGISFLFHFRW